MLNFRAISALQYCTGNFFGSDSLPRCFKPGGHTPSTAATFRRNFRKNSGKTPETLSERFLEFPSRVRLGSPKPHNSRQLRLPEYFQNSLPPGTAGDASFFQKWFRRGTLRAGHGIPSSTGGISETWWFAIFTQRSSFALFCALVFALICFFLRVSASGRV